VRVRRDISSIPQRSATDTWLRLVDLVTGPDSSDVAQLRDASSVVATVITDEHPGTKPIVFEGVGPQLRVFFRYGLKAIEEGDTVDALTWNPTAGDWSMRLPCDSENIDWVRKALAKTSRRITVFDIATEERTADAETVAAASARGIEVDWNLKG
jgi:hypothetical protein